MAKPEMGVAGMVDALSQAESRDGFDYRLQFFGDGSGAVYVDDDEEDAHIQDPAFEFLTVEELEDWLYRRDRQ